MTLPTDIQEIFFDTLSGDKTILEFEEWLYKDKRLETILNSDDYLELISFGYKLNTAKKWLHPLLSKHIDKGEFEKRRVRKLLTKALNRDEDLPQLIMIFYDMYCKGYNFFDNLGLGYGLRVKVPGINNYEDTWDDLSETEQTNLINSFYPDLDTEIKKVISWVDTGKVVLTGIKDEYNHFEYVDNRTELEKQPTGYKVATVQSNAQKPWWKFW